MNISPFGVGGSSVPPNPARRLTELSFLADKRLWISDRDSKYSTTFRSLLTESGVEPVRMPARSPNLNAHAERFVRPIKDECLSQVIFFGERLLKQATRKYASHYHR